jgi:cytochrome c oxidase subunit II
MTRLAVLLTGLSLLTTGCDGKWSRGGFPDPITQQGHNLLGLWRGSLITSGIVGLFVIVLILASALFFRRRSDELPRQVRYNLPIEVLYTVVPVIIIAVMFYFTAIRENDEDKFSAKPDVTIGVVGFQWSWQFNYPQEGFSVTGRPGQYPTLELPVRSHVLFNETSPDVVHSFWVIPFLFKRDVVPGRLNRFEVYLTRQGTFAGKCTEYCGTDHDRMLFTVKVVSQSDYQQWVSQTKQTAQAGTDPTVATYTNDAPTYGSARILRSRQ